MAKGKKILARRKTVRNIHKITRTMEMVSTGRFRRAQRRLESLRAYTDAIGRMVHNLLQAAGTGEDHPLMRPGANAAPEAVVLVTSNRGLCGGYNAEVLRAFARLYDELRAGDADVEVCVYGLKGRRHLRYRGIEPAAFHPAFEREVPLDDVIDLAEGYIERFLDGRLRRLQVVYTRYVSSSVQHAQVVALLPIGRLEALAREPRDALAPRRGPIKYDFWPDAEGILDKLLPRTVCLRLFRMFLDAAAGEQVARMTAMHQATENAEETIDELTMQYNRERQRAITRELAEIVGGSEAMA